MGSHAREWEGYQEERRIASWKDSRIDKGQVTRDTRKKASEQGKDARNAREGKKDRRIEGSREGRKTAGRKKERETETKGNGEKAREKGTEKENREREWGKRMGKTDQAAQQQIAS
jgi:hypothetical protein